MKNNHRYRFFSVHTVTGTIFVILVTYLLGQITLNIDFFNPVQQALADFKITDVVYSDFKEKRPPEQNIVLVNIGNLDRAGLAAELEIINSYGPAVIGIDAFFKNPKDPEGDSLLAAAMRNTKNLVLVSKLDSFADNSQNFTHRIKSIPLFSEKAHSGYANFITGADDGFLTTRRFTTNEKLNAETEWSFASKILSIYAPEKFQQLAKRPKQQEVINYNGNLEHFFHLDYPDVFDETKDLSFLKGKIVLMGFLGEPMGKPSLDDVFFTPLNESKAGRSFPDMYGITVHANILSMMLGGFYIQQTPYWLDPLLAIVLCMLNVALFLYVGYKFRDISQLTMRIIQIVEGSILTGLMFYFLTVRDIEVDFEKTLVLVFLTADLAEIYEGSAKNLVERYKTKLQFGRKAKLSIYKKRKQRAIDLQDSE